jgi:IS4 transposase
MELRHTTASRKVVDTFINLRVLTGFYPAKDYPDKLRRIKYHDIQTNKTLVFLTNNFILPALTICDLYRYRWQVELFFKWIKQLLRI